MMAKRTEALEDVLANEKKFQLITENSPDAIFITDKKGDYTYVNKVACDLLGYSFGELTKMNISGILEYQDVEENFKSFRKLVGEESLFIELNLVRKDGSVVPVDLNSVVLPNGMIYGRCRDLTERNRALEALREESKERFQLICSNRHP